jgi:hypothetical protein
MKCLKKVGRYLASCAGACVKLEPTSNDIKTVVGYTDADWAGDKFARRSTSGSALFVAGVLVHSFSRTQSLVALSSCEAELYALTGHLA